MAVVLQCTSTTTEKNVFVLIEYQVIVAYSDFLMFLYLLREMSCNTHIEVETGNITTKYNKVLTSFLELNTVYEIANSVHCIMEVCKF